MMSNTISASPHPIAAWRRMCWLGGLLLAIASLCLLPAPAHAQSCWVSGSATLNFGTVTASANTDAQTTLAVNCQAGFNTFLNAPTLFRVCMFVGAGNPTGTAPRRMTNNNGAFMNYNLYSDAARTQLLGPLGSSPLYSQAINIPEGTTSLINLPIYGRVPMGQTLPAAFPYQGFPAGSVVRYSYGLFITPTEAECRNGTPGLLGGAGEVPFSWSGVYANYANACHVIVATDLDFGSAGALTANRDQTSTIQLQCPTGANWRVNLDNGINASGSTRRMASGVNRITYELYRDPVRQNRWGNTTTTGVTGTGTNTAQSLTVYGRVPAQATPASGSYADTIIVTLTY